jgi:hypothetical protein
VDPVFAWIEQTPLSDWLREADTFFAFPAVLTVHVISLGLVVGSAVALDLRALGFLREIPAKAMDAFVGLIWVAFVFVIASGLLLVIAYPTKALTNPLFYFKLVCILLAVWALLAVRRRMWLSGAGGVSFRVKTVAVASIGLWAVAITSGRFLAYTCTRLMVDFGKCP